MTRFPDEKILKTSSGCWMWTGLTQGGYGKWNGRHAHRIVYELLVGEIPPGLELDHLCRVAGCVNPEHLEPVTGEENRRRKYASITTCKNGHAFDEANTYYRLAGGRDCRRCMADRARKYQQRRRSAA